MARMIDSTIIGNRNRKVGDEEAAFDVLKRLFDVGSGRRDKIVPSAPPEDFTKLKDLSARTLIEMGCQRFNAADSNGDVLWLFPGEWFDSVPKGHKVDTIDGDNLAFDKDVRSNETKSGALPFGFKRQKQEGDELIKGGQIWAVRVKR